MGHGLRRAAMSGRASDGEMAARFEAKGFKHRGMKGQKDHHGNDRQDDSDWATVDGVLDAAEARGFRLRHG